MAKQDKAQNPSLPPDPTEALSLLQSIEDRINELKTCRPAHSQSDAAELKRLLKKADREKQKIREQYKRLEAWRVRLLHRRKAMQYERVHMEELEAHYAELVRQRRAILDAQHVLAAAEDRMRKRWATHHAGLVTGVMALTLLLFGFISHWYGQHTAHTTWRATAVLAAPESAPGYRQKPWLDSHRERLLSEDTLDRTIFFLSQASHRPYSNVGKLRAALDERLTIRSIAQGEVELVFVDRTDERAVAMVEAMTRAYRAGWPADTAVPMPVVVRAAASDDQPIDDPRLTRSIQCFIIIVGGAALIFWALRRWVLRTTQVFRLEDDDTLNALQNESSWPGAAEIEARQSEGQPSGVTGPGTAT